ncbi:Flagellum-specific ATP synthase FliI [hydrothermal vent metagenome]|uniref:Flagellum-specific ATP synthase n=1 Tax=hydrothermal vent metagenome TaxID=652676 RepID=A0A3B0YT80_9ZZZZ
MSKQMLNHNQRWSVSLKQYRDQVKPLTVMVEGKLSRMVGLTLEAVGCQAAIGSHCQVLGANDISIEAEVVGFSGEKLYLMPTGSIQGLMVDARIIPTGYVYKAAVGDALLGRVIGGSGEALDGKGPIETTGQMVLTGKQINPLQRSSITEPLDVGVRSINSLLTVGRGQRLGLFAGSGVGKSVLLGMMTKYTNADVIVVGLIGERGREVKDFVKNILGDVGMQRAVVVATPADTPPLMRMHGALLATTIAEYFRDQGKNVLLLMDSLTRYAQAQREIALAIGEPPVSKGYPPSVYAKIPQLVERAGNGDDNGGSITAFYTVLAEGDDQQDPVADAARAILDGHIVLSRRIAESGQYPAIDIEASISRVMTDIVSQEHREATQRFRMILAAYERDRDLISVGAYQRGTDPRVDEAINYNPLMMSFLRQDMNERFDFNQSYQELLQMMQTTPPAS